MRLCNGHDHPGVEVFVYGEGGGPFPARQHREACEAVARSHRLSPDRVLFARQSDEAIAAGAFHNDVVAVANERVLFAHEQAFADRDSFYADLRSVMPGVEIVEVPADRVSLEDAISSYLFNAQLVTPPDGQPTLILPQEARDNAAVWSWLQEHVAGNGPIRRLEVVNVRDRWPMAAARLPAPARRRRSRDRRAALSGRPCPARPHRRRDRGALARGNRSDRDRRSCPGRKDRGRAHCPAERAGLSQFGKRLTLGGGAIRWCNAPMWSRLVALFTIKSKFEAFLVIYGLGLGAVERGMHYLTAYPGLPGKILFAACPIAVFMAGARILDSLSGTIAIDRISWSHGSLATLSDNPMTGLTHLQRLEAESIHILREVVAETERPVMLYSVGKDSAVMLHLAKKAFFRRARPSRCCMSIRPGNSRRCTSCATARPKRRGWS